LVIKWITLENENGSRNAKNVNLSGQNAGLRENQPVKDLFGDSQKPESDEDDEGFGDVPVYHHVADGKERIRRKGREEEENEEEERERKKLEKQKEKAMLDEEEEIEEILTEESLKSRLAEANQAKEEGNQAFGVGDYETAIQHYLKALSICPKKRIERSIYHGNLAACQIKLNRFQEAIESCDRALKLDPNYLKILQRRAQAKEKKGGLDGLIGALEDYQKVLETDKSNKQAQQAVKTLPPLIEAEKEKQKQELLSKFKSFGNTILGKFGLSTDNFQMKQDPATGSYSVNFVQNAK